MSIIEEYQFVELDGVKIAYRSHGKGRPVLMIHGFASFSYTWQPMINSLPDDQFCFYTMDMKGFGYSEKICDTKLSPFDQAQIISSFIRHFDLDDIVLCGHSMGGAACLIALFDENLRKRVSRLVLIDSAGFFNHLPDFIDQLSSTTAKNPLLQHVNGKILAQVVLSEVYYDNGKISDELLEQYGELLKLEGTIECLIAAANQVAIANIRSFHQKLKSINLPALILWGEEDQIIDVEDAFYFKSDLPGSILKIIPECGHSPQEEKPEETAQVFQDFLDDKLELDTNSEPDKTLLEEVHAEAAARKPRVRMRKLLDRWSIGAVTLIFLFKLLQILKKLGFKAGENGWRKASAVYFRHEHSKFTLTSFRLDYLSHRPGKHVDDMDSAKRILINRLSEFLRKTPECHWRIVNRRFIAKSKKNYFVDIIEAEFDKKGNLLKIVPHFDRTYNNFPLLDKKFRKEIISKLIEGYNIYKKTDDRYRDRKVSKYARKKLKKNLTYFRAHSEIEFFMRRIIFGTFINFERMPEDPEKAQVKRFKTPPFHMRKHLGGGLLNIHSRFSHDLKEADLWIQFHHAPVDGAPMQKVLSGLSEEWGKAGEVLFPATDTPAAKTEFTYFGRDVFRARAFLDFSGIFEMRKKLNEKYYVEMGGPASLGSMLLWGLSHMEAFQDIKFVMPVDSSRLKNGKMDNLLSLLFIRPQNYRSGNTLKDFFEFQREFNQKLFATRMGHSESHEMLELMALTHPATYALVKRLIPKSLGDIVGTLCFSVIRDAEFFIAPIGMLQDNGFIAIGSCVMKTEDGKTVGTVSICHNKQKIRSYLKDLRTVVEDFNQFI